MIPARPAMSAAALLAICASPAWSASVDYVGKLSLPAAFPVSSLDLFGSTALIGGSGSALVYDLASDAAIATLSAPGGSGGSGFGRAVAARDNRYLVGDTGAAYLYDFNGAPRVTRLGGAGADDRFGSEVALTGDLAAVSSTTAAGENSVDLYSAADGAFYRALTPMVDAGGQDGSRFRDFGSSIALGDGVAAVANGEQVVLLDTRTGESIRTIEGDYYGGYFVGDIGLDGPTLLTGLTISDFGYGVLDDLIGGTRSELLFIDGNRALDSLLGYSVGLSFPYAVLGDTEGCGLVSDGPEDYCGSQEGLVGLFDARTGDSLARIESPNFPLEGERFGDEIAIFDRTVLASNGAGDVFRYRIVEDDSPPAVPLPASGLLLAAGLLGLLRGRRSPPAI